MGSRAGVVKGAAAKIGVPLSLYQQLTAAGQKWCTACKRWHPRKAFGRDKSRSDGLAAKCNAVQLTVSLRPGVHERRIQRRRGLKWCRGCTTWLPSAEVTQGACRYHLNEAARAWYLRNPGVVARRNAARERGLEPVPEWWRAEMFEAFGGLCAYGCGRPAVALDHVWPVVNGGVSRPSNLVPTCRSCNSSKGGRPPWSWIDRGLRAFPRQWEDLIALDMEGPSYFELEAA